MVIDRQIKSRLSDRHVLHLFDNMMKELHENKPRYTLRPGKKREDCLKLAFGFEKQEKVPKVGNGNILVLRITYKFFGYKGEYTNHSDPINIHLDQDNKVYSHYDYDLKKTIYIDFTQAIDRMIRRALNADWLVKDNTSIPVYL